MVLIVMDCPSKDVAGEPLVDLDRHEARLRTRAEGLRGHHTRARSTKERPYIHGTMRLQGCKTSAHPCEECSPHP